MSETTNAPSKVVREITDSIGRLHMIGGIGLVLAGGAIIVFASSALFPEVATATAAIPRFYDFTLIMAVIGSVIGAGERFLEYRLTEQRMRMLAAVTERVIGAATPTGHRLNQGEVEELVNTVFKAVWTPTGNEPKLPDQTSG